MKNVIKKFFAVAVCVTALFSAVIAAGRMYSHMQTPKNKDAPQKTVRLNTQSPSNETLYTPSPPLLQDALKSVVGISSTDLSSSSDREISQYSGSGVLVSEDGYIITNQHVIRSRPQRVEVTLSDGEVKDGKTVWSDRALDLAVVKISGKGYIFSKMGDSKKLCVGENVYAIGNPLSMQFERTVTAGIISAKGRSINIEDENGISYYMEDLIQTDASINPGNSGGPLMNTAGDIIGINTVKVSSAEGMGFAVPINVCVPIIERLQRGESFSTPYLGLYAYTAAAARYFGKKETLDEGLFVAKIDTDGPAFKAGIRYGDIIKGINKKNVNTMLELREELYCYQKGDSVKIEYERNGIRKISTVILSEE